MWWQGILSMPYVTLPATGLDSNQVLLLLSVLQVFIHRCSHPRWTPVTVVTQNAEDWHFCNLFPDWAWQDLAESSKAPGLRLPLLRPPVITYPTTGKLKVLATIRLEESR